MTTFIRTVTTSLRFAASKLVAFIRFVLISLWHWLTNLLRALLQLWRSLGPRPLRVLLVIVVLGAAGYMELKRYLAPNSTDESIYQLRYLNAGWTQQERDAYYFTPQGTELLGLEYNWFVNLELPLSDDLLAGEAVMRGWGFIVDPAQQPSAVNTGNLPVGFSRHKDPATGRENLDLGCALCHTGELHYQGVALRVDGGQSVQSVPTAKRGEFISTLGASALETLYNPAKWDRFATRVVGRDQQARDKLRADFKAFAGRLKAFVKGPGAAKWYPVEEGRGRTDAVGRIANVVFGFDIDAPENYRVADAPASYPFLWDIWRFDWVQYTGFTNQAMARNVGESLGVLAPIKLVGKNGKLLSGKEFGETVIDVDGMRCVESLLRKLKPPAWPEDILGEINTGWAREGKTLFQEKCVGCHGPHISQPYDWAVADNPDSNPDHQVDVNWQWDMAGDISEVDGKPVRKDWRPRMWSVPWVDVATVGTDSQLADNFVNNTYNAQKLLPGAPPVNAGNGLQVLLNRLVPDLYQRWGISGMQIPAFDGLNVPFRIANKKAYKARPLHGVWATPPFLHNGSVPTLYHLLSPQRERPTEFYVGQREYDPDLLGYRTEYSPGSFKHDTHVTGNGNGGHLFTNLDVAGRIGSLLSEHERRALMEYIKVMGNPAFDEALGGDPLNWDHYVDAPADPAAVQACIDSHRDQHGIQFLAGGDQ